MPLLTVSKCGCDALATSGVGARASDRQQRRLGRVDVDAADTSSSPHRAARSSAKVAHEGLRTRAPIHVIDLDRDKPSAQARAARRASASADDAFPAHAARSRATSTTTVLVIEVALRSRRLGRCFSPAPPSVEVGEHVALSQRERLTAGPPSTGQGESLSRRSMIERKRQACRRMTQASARLGDTRRWHGARSQGSLIER